MFVAGCIGSMIDVQEEEFKERDNGKVQAEELEGERERVKTAALFERSKP